MTVTCDCNPCDFMCDIFCHGIYIYTSCNIILILILSPKIRKEIENKIKMRKEIKSTVFNSDITVRSTV